MHLKISSSRLLQALTGLLQVANIAAPHVPSEYKEVFGAALVLLHFGINELAHKSTPEGQPVK